MVIEYLTAILVFVTTIYVYLTFRMVQTSESSVKAIYDQSEAMLRPYVVIEPYVRSHTQFLYLRIKNTGKTAAENLSITIDRDFFQFGEKRRNLREATAFNEPIDSLAPESEILFALAQGSMIFGGKGDMNLTPEKFEVSTEYQFADKTVSENHKIDLRPFKTSEGAKDPIVEELERIRKSIKSSN